MTRHAVPDLLPGTLDLLILRTLQTDSLHGWAISERIQQISQDVLQINQGSLYPALHRLEHQGWIDAEWAVSSWAGGPVRPAHTIRPPATGRGSPRQHGASSARPLAVPIPGHVPRVPLAAGRVLAAARSREETTPTRARPRAMRPVRQPDRACVPSPSNRTPVSLAQSRSRPAWFTPVRAEPAARCLALFRHSGRGDSASARGVTVDLEGWRSC